MELREWLIILGLALVSLIVIDGIRRLKRQRRVPRLDKADYTDADDSDMDPEEARREAELNWELPNGGARIIKSANYTNSTGKPKLQRQEHPGPSRVLSEFRRSKATSAATGEKQGPPLHTASQTEQSSASADSTNSKPVGRRSAEAPVSSAEPPMQDQSFSRITAIDDDRDTSPADSSPEPQNSDNSSLQGGAAQPETSIQPDARRRQLRPSTVGDYSDETDEEDTSYQLVDFHGIKDSLKHRMQERLEEHKQKKLDKQKRKDQLKAEKAERAIEAEKLKAQRAAQEAERRREAQLHADAARAQQAEREAHEQRELHQVKGERQNGVERSAQYNGNEGYNDSLNAGVDSAAAGYGSERYAYDDNGHHDDGYASEGYKSDDYDDVVRPHPTLAKAMRNDVSGKHAADTLQNAEEVVVISVMSRDEDGFEGDKLLELLMMCGLRYSSDMGVFHRLETEHPESELQFSMVNVVKPGTFPIQEMDTFVTPGITFLMPLPGAEDSSAAFEAMVETAMVVVRHMGGELKDENRSVMTAQTIEFARQRVHEFERRHHLHRVQAN